MIYVTGDTHQDFSRFTKQERKKLPFHMDKDDYVIICGDFGLLWSKDKTLDYNLDWLSRLPFKILWVQGNHENYDMIAEYPIEQWCGGKVRHILRDKIILLERGQIFNIEGKIIFTFGGASSHDVQGGILDKTASDYSIKKRKAILRNLPYRVINESWWEAELPTEEEQQEGRNNLEKVGWKVDYVISHCCSSEKQDEIAAVHHATFDKDILTEYFSELESRLTYKQWFFGHYHIDSNFDTKHTVLYKRIIPIEEGLL